MTAVNGVSKTGSVYGDNSKPATTLKASFAKMNRMLFNPDGTVAKFSVPVHSNSGSIHGFGYANGTSAGASTNI